METANTFSELKNIVKEAKKQNKTISFVPTMGALHEGHLSLIKKARKTSDFVIASVFVNPTQFGPNEDFDKYPRDLKKDLSLLEAYGVDVVFAPSVMEVYLSEINNKNKQDIYKQNQEIPHFDDLPDMFNQLEGEVRSGFFVGVAQILFRFFSQIDFDTCVFGQKDYQQTRLVQYLLDKYFATKKLIVAPIIREPNGLAMSSRNEYFDNSQRAKASIIFQSLIKAKTLFEEKFSLPNEVIEEVRQNLLTEKEIKKIKYIEIRDKDSFEKLDKITKNSIILISVDFASVHLIDNMLFG